MKKDIINRKEIIKTIARNNKKWDISEETAKSIVYKRINSDAGIEKWGITYYKLCVDVLFLKLSEFDNQNDANDYLEYIKMNQESLCDSEFIQNLGLYLSIVIAILSVAYKAVPQFIIIVLLIYLILFSTVFCISMKYSFQIRFYKSVIDNVMKNRDANH